ncbi:MltR family transcriptional regulator [Bradyrhizobium sp. Ai1a-2]|uniref:MltR family transcriptional regulator n=1 Tax=Bradyrhizobium sp. Ai1a-2 TaxID=196490 RepID=UPI0004065C91|nr:MltR family transcriptional regulator [Bradyrhizobium sp. Ai1a-2]
MARRTAHTSEQITSAVKEIQEQTDRGSAIVGAALMEEMLSVVLQKRMSEMNKKHYETFFGQNGPGSTLSNKIELFYALGLCNDSLYKAMHDIRAIRNKFAHRIEPLTFNDPSIADLVDQLSSAGFDLSNRRQKFIALISIILSLIYATGADDIRVKFIGETHSELYIDVLKRFFPEHASTFDQVWKHYNKD